MNKVLYCAQTTTNESGVVVLLETERVGWNLIRSNIVRERKRSLIL